MTRAAPPGPRASEHALTSRVSSGEEGEWWAAAMVNATVRMRRTEGRAAVLAAAAAILLDRLVAAEVLT